MVLARLMETQTWCPPVPSQWCGRGASQRDNGTGRQFGPRVALTAALPALTLKSVNLTSSPYVPGPFGAAVPESECREGESVHGPR